MVRVGIIGFGGMGRFHSGYLTAGKVPDAQLTAVCDVDETALEEARNRFGDTVQRFSSAEALLQSGAVDAVMIETPHYFHPQLAIAALQHNIHVLVEKPAGVYTKQVREMNEAAAKSDRVFGIMFNQRTHGYHQKMREIVQSGELGEIKRTQYVITDWFRSQAYYDSGSWRATWAGEGGGVLVNQCPHNLDLWQWICGMPVRVRAFCQFGRYHDIEVEDNVTAYVEYENGATGVFITSTGEAPGAQSLEVVGDRGRLRLENEKLTFWRTTVPVSEFLQNSPFPFEKPEVWKCELSAAAGEEHLGVTKNWISAIAHGTPLYSKGTDGINGVELANAMQLSTWTDNWVNLPVDEDLFYETLQEKIRTSTFKKKTNGKTINFG